MYKIDKHDGAHQQTETKGHTTAQQIQTGTSIKLHIYSNENSGSALSTTKAVPDQSPRQAEVPSKPWNQTDVHSHHSPSKVKSQPGK